MPGLISDVGIWVFEDNNYLSPLLEIANIVAYGG